MHRAGGSIKSAWVDQEERTFSCCYCCELGKSNIVADSQPDLSILGHVEDGDLVARRKDIAFLECDLARYVNVE